MVKQSDKGWALPRRPVITKQILQQAIATEKALAAREHQAVAAWFDRAHDAVMVMLKGGRVFGAQRACIPSLQDATARQLAKLRPSDDGAFLEVEPMGLHINVEGLVSRIIAESPLTVRRVGASMAGKITSAAKAAAAARNGQAGGRPRKERAKVSEAA